MALKLTRVSAVAAALFFLSTGPARAAADTGLVALAEVGGGVTSVVAHASPVESVTFGGVASSIRLGVGGHRGRLDFGVTGGALRAWSTQSSTAALFQRPEEFLMLSVGPFVGYRPALDLPLTIGARLELARGQMTGVTATANAGAATFPGGSTADFFEPGNGVLGAARADYALEGRYGAATFGLEVAGGWLSGGGNTLSVVSATAGVGYRWR
jgi:hypothetical protein